MNVCSSLLPPVRKPGPVGSPSKPSEEEQRFLDEIDEVLSSSEVTSQPPPQIPFGSRGGFMSLGMVAQGSTLT